MAQQTPFNPVTELRQQTYNTVAASQTAQGLAATQAGGTGAIGDYLDGVLIVPATASPGTVQIKDGSDSAITIFAGGASSLTELKPIWVPICALSKAGAWQITTGANVSVVAVGRFT